eukprot:2681472-Rhodomonas_salina.1
MARHVAAVGVGLVRKRADIKAAEGGGSEEILVVDPSGIEEKYGDMTLHVAGTSYALPYATPSTGHRIWSYAIPYAIPGTEKPYGATQPGAIVLRRRASPPPPLRLPSRPAAPPPSRRSAL